eukprot:CAMPEP_0196656284 /NCGR_PEP_ID=MMETSP1086-20130531/15453_1 /TAXON_ID=77921 /ORGANISM="Cyanoptyche  gloeocystis , Strain SAG4.97" /LENGTH=176 /DNA_ID=CAMNT_0041988985 /DNA_START=81 /DNA_END=611 /DNA_ORIENTATION=+
MGRYSDELLVRDPWGVPKGMEEKPVDGWHEVSLQDVEAPVVCDPNRWVDVEAGEGCLGKVNEYKATLGGLEGRGRGPLRKDASKLERMLYEGLGTEGHDAIPAAGDLDREVRSHHGLVGWAKEPGEPVCWRVAGKVPRGKVVIEFESKIHATSSVVQALSGAEKPYRILRHEDDVV